MRKSSLILAGVLSVVALLAGCGSNVPVLHVYTWADYIDPEVLADFEKEFSCSVAVDTFDSNEAMFAKLQAGSSGYDIITPTSYQIPLMAKAGMIRPLDKTLLPNVVKNFDKGYYAAILDKDMTYNVPYAVTYTGFAYRKDRIGDAPINSWRIFETDALRGRMSLLSDMRETIGGALIYLGYSVNTEDAKQIDEAAQLVIKWKKNVAKFDNEQYKTAVASAEWFVGHGYSSDSTQIMEDDENVGFVLPKEGFVIACDELVISKEAPNAELAHKFIDFFYRSDIAKRNMEYVLAPMPVTPALNALDAETRAKVVVPEELLKKGQVVIDFDGEKAHIRDLYVKAWDKIKATGSK